MDANDKYLFSVTVVDVLDGRKLGPAKYDEDGYTWQPAAVINRDTENETYYDPEDIRNNINDPNNRFNINLRRGNLHGEMEHPDVPGTMEDLPRLLNVKLDRVSHHIRAVKTVPYPGVPGSYIIFLLIKPVGEKGPYLKEALDDKYRNSALSLRSIVREHYDKVKRVKYRNIIQLVTFDWVTVPGSYEASKRWSNLMGAEAYCKEILPSSFMRLAQNVSYGLESLHDYDLKTFLNASAINVCTVSGELTSGSKLASSNTFLEERTGKVLTTNHLGFKLPGGIR